MSTRDEEVRLARKFSHRRHRMYALALVLYVEGFDDDVQLNLHLTSPRRQAFVPRMTLRYVYVRGLLYSQQFTHGQRSSMQCFQV